MPVDPRTPTSRPPAPPLPGTGHHPWRTDTHGPLRSPLRSPSRSLLAALAASAATAFALGGCGGGGDGDDTAPPPAQPSLITGATVSAVPAGREITVSVDAFSATGTREEFTFTSTDPYASVSRQADGALKVSGQRVGRQRIDLTSASGAKKSITVDVYDPMTMDIGGGLLMKYVATHDRRFIAGGNDRLQAAHPRTGGGGWYALGSVMRRGWDDLTTVRDTAVIVLRDTSAAQDRLRAPTGYQQVWWYPGFFTVTPGSVWNPVCPTGYVAMGVVAVAGTNPPSTDEVRCVNREHTVAGKVGAWVVDDEGSGAPGDITVYRPARPDREVPDGFAFLPAGTMVAAPVARSANNPGAVDPATVNVLLVNLPQVRTGTSGDYEPRLAGYAPFEPRVARSQSAVRVPFELVSDPDPQHTLAWRVDNSPFYTIVREERYVPGNSLDNRQSANATKMTYETEFGWSQTDYSKFSQELGIEVTVGGSFKFVSAQATVSLKLAWEQSTSTTYSTVTTNTYEWTVPPGVFAQVLHVKSEMRVFTETGQAAGALPMKSSILKYVQYPLP